MKHEKIDRRVRYTKLALKESIIELLQKKSIDKISIKEICETADINRSTFYAHYKDQYDLIHQIEQELLMDINEYLNNYNFKGYETESFQLVVSIFEYIVDNAELCKVLLGKHGDIALQKEVMMLIQKQSLKDLERDKALEEDMLEYLIIFSVNGSIGIIQKWLQDGMKKPAREMAEIVTRLIFEGFSAYV